MQPSSPPIPFVTTKDKCPVFKYTSGVSDMGNCFFAVPVITLYPHSPLCPSLSCVGSVKIEDCIASSNHSSAPLYFPGSTIILNRSPSTASLTRKRKYPLIHCHLSPDISQSLGVVTTQLTPYQPWIRWRTPQTSPRSDSHHLRRPRRRTPFHSTILLFYNNITLSAPGFPE